MAWQCYNGKLWVEAQLDLFSIGLDTWDKLTEEHGELLGCLLEIHL